MKTKLRFLSGDSLPEGPGGDLLDLRSLTLISRRPEIYRAHTLEPRSGPKAPATGKRKALVLLVDFSDNLPSTPAEKLQDMLFSRGSYPTGSLRDYYQEASYKSLDIDGDVIGGEAGWFRAPNSYSYYTNNSYGFGSYPRNVYKLVEDCLEMAASVVNFSDYDMDGDGQVDCLFIVHAGHGAEETGDTNHIWSHMSAIEPVTIDGVSISRYSMEPENGRIGVFCHELGHVLGLPDLYDYGFDSAGTGCWDLMAGGCWNNAGNTPAHPIGWCKVKLGWVSPLDVGSSKSITLRPSATYPDIYRIPADGSSDQYFLLENRSQRGFDKFIPGEGLVILHVDESMSNNNNQSHYLVDIEQCDGRCDLNKNMNSGDSGDAFPSSALSAFNADTKPSSRTYSGADSKFAINGIRRSGESIVLNIGREEKPKEPVWYRKKILESAYANCGPQWAWAKISGLGWRRIKEGHPQSVTCAFNLCCEAVSKNRKVDVYADDERIHIIYLL